MWKKILLGCAGLIVVTLAAGYLFREPLTLALIASQIKPTNAFAMELAPTAPDYADDSAWAALPSRQDPSDDQPDNTDLPNGPHSVDVFFVHPTSYLKPDNWNQPLTDETANWVVDERVLRHQASVFNTCCDVYAPRYRQATFFSFMDPGPDGNKALDLAYSDVAAAFSQFIADLPPGRPFILAGHSQGTAHAARLLREQIANTPLRERLVAAYLVGFSIAEADLGGVPICLSATATGCAVGWNAADAEGRGLFPDANVFCVNPLTWRTDAEHGPNDLNKGAIGYPRYDEPEEGEDYTRMHLEPGAADAQCIGSKLAVAELRSEAFPSRMPGGSMHIYDYSLYHMNIRENAELRARTFLHIR